MDEPKQTMMRYLLGELSEQEQVALEEKYFTDPQVFDQMLKTESELVDEYARGYLSTEVRERFEKFYMTRPGLIERVKFARALTARLDQIEEPAASAEKTPLAISSWQWFLMLLRDQRPVLGFSVALAILLLLGGVWVFVESRRRQQRELAQAQAAREAQERPRSEESQQETGTRKTQEESTAPQASPLSTPQQKSVPSPSPTVNSAPQTVSLALTVGGVRSGNGDRIPTLVIPQGTVQTRLQLVLKDNDYPSYQASLQTVGGTEIFSRSGVKPRSTKSGASFVFTLPASKLAGGDYVLTLRGISPDGEIDDLGKSLFRVEKR